jgi:hypothetical protein
MSKHLVLVHGRSFKPDEASLTANWLEALRHGLERDAGAAALAAFENAHKTMAYYGDLSNDFLRSVGREYDEIPDIEDRQRALQDLKGYSEADFIANGRVNYEALPGQDAVKEFLVDVFSGPVSLFGLGDNLISLVAPDMGQYWNQESDFGRDVRKRLTDPLKNALQSGQDVMLVSHSLGTLVAYDVLWKFSHYGEYEHIRGESVSTWVTMGSPLGDENIKQNLKGSGIIGSRRYPHNVRRWFNIAAEDDYISHDEDVANDYADMLNITPIADHGIYNLAVRHGNSNPHHGAGYLIHPTVINLLKNWLE